MRLLSDNKLYLPISLYLLFRLPFLTGLPIFNDEAIYLDWGWRTINIPGMLFYPLFDAKQPLLMWIFGFAQKLFPDPLFAGRLVSVLVGLLTGLGLFQIAKNIFGQKVALVTFIFYILTPIFTFYDRQALMETAVSAVGIWSVYFWLKLIQERRIVFSLLLGSVVGLGILIKSTAFYFLLPITILSLKKVMADKKNRPFFLNLLFLSLIISQIILLPLYGQSLFWATLKSNDRYIFTLSELLSFPFQKWLSNLVSFVDILFWQFSPALFLLSGWGIFQALRKKTPYASDLVIWFAMQVFLLVFLGRMVSPRYLVVSLPLLCLFSAFVFVDFWEKRKQLAQLFILLFAFTLFLTTTQIINPLYYFDFLHKNSNHSQKSSYVTGWPSGYGIAETRQYLEEKAKDGTILVGVRLDSGNPESAILTYYHDHPTIKAINFDSNIFPQLKDLPCLQANLPFYFVSRDEQLGGFNKFFKEEMRFYKPDSDRYIGIYSFSDCSQENIRLN